VHSFMGKRKRILFGRFIKPDTPGKDEVQLTDEQVEEVRRWPRGWPEDLVNLDGTPVEFEDELEPLKEDGEGSVSVAGGGSAQGKSKPKGKDEPGSPSKSKGVS